MLVDDSKGDVRLLKSILQKEPFKIEVAYGGKIAVEMAESILPDLILLDIMMPDQDGYSTCEQLRNIEATKDIPIIFITGKTEKKDIVKGFQIGGNDYITKPYYSLELILRINNQLELISSKKMIEKESHERRQLIHILCHDLTNPLGYIKGLLDNLDDIDDIKQLKDALGDSVAGGLSLIKLVRRMSALEDNVIDIQEIHLKVAIKYSTKILENSFKQKKIKLVVDVPDQMVVLAELVSLTNSVLNNLLTNAHKFSYPGSKVWITAVEKENSTELSIRDEGIGIPQKMHDNLFSLGMAKNRKGTRQEEGTGFGMPLVRKFMLAYGGNIRFESTDEKENPNQKGTNMILTFMKG